MCPHTSRISQPGQTKTPIRRDRVSSCDARSGIIELQFMALLSFMIASATRPKIPRFRPRSLAPRIGVVDARNQRTRAEPSGEPLSFAARQESRALADVGRGGASRSAGARQADPALDRLRRLPLVPCGGA